MYQESVVYFEDSRELNKSDLTTEMKPPWVQDSKQEEEYLSCGTGDRQVFSSTNKSNNY